LWLLDASGYIYRAFHALPPLSNAEGFPTNAIYGFTMMLLKLLRDHAPTYLAVVGDAGGETERHRAFEAYKAQRPPMPESLVRQVPLVWEMVDALAIPRLMQEGVEADDIIGTMVRRAETAGWCVTIVTGDKDFFQLVTPRVRVYDAMRDRTYGEAEVRARYGVPPGTMVDLFALAGDPVDNIPGVPGIGEKTAGALLQRFGSVDGLLQHLREIERPKLREQIAAHRDRILENRSLVAIRSELELPVRLADLSCGPTDRGRLRNLCQMLGFTRIGESFGF
ncbi:MAG: 5'-3' exonuclease H3TH domain-containing protein, partial [Candidatus Methylomirabilales bacterium]